MASRGEGINLYVAVTDGDWFDFLRLRPGLDEANFWQPGGNTSFKALRAGELFLFKLHSPRNFIVGGGVFTHSSTIPLSMAWESFGEKNGAGSLEEMRRRISKYRRRPASEKEDFLVGCRILSAPFFFLEADWIPIPLSWKRQTQTGKTYRTSGEEGLRLWNEVRSRMELASASQAREESPRYGLPALFPPRLGQGGFRFTVIDAYGRRCSMTGEKVLPALEAAHIRPYGRGGTHSVNNGLLLRRDLHRLFDLGYMTTTPEYRVEVSRRIREEFDNGREYFKLHGQRVSIPSRPLQRPSVDLLRWHNEEVFLG